MRRSAFGRNAAVCCAMLAMLAGCGGSAPLAGAPDAPPPVAAARQAGDGMSWMSPLAKSADLLYVSDTSGRIYVYSYPGGAPMGQLTGFSGPSGLCSDKAGDVFVANTAAQAVVEYAHGKNRPITTLSDFGYYPFGCAVDPTTGNLAVTNVASSPAQGPGNLLVYPNAKSPPTAYADPAFVSYFFCGYDNKGNLVIDGTNGPSTQSKYAELPAGAAALSDISLDQTIGYPGGVQWDGTNWALKDTFSNALYRVALSGSSGTVVGTDHLDGQKSTLLVQFWIQGRTVVMPYSSSSRQVKKIGFWAYPGGGSPNKTIARNHVAELVGVTVSRAK